MLTKNIDLTNFLNTKKNVQIIKIFNNLKKNFKKKKDRLLLSLSQNYEYYFTINQIKKYKKFKFFNIIGMGGSALGTAAIYTFLKFKIKKKFFFFNNLNLKKTIQNKELNIFVSKSGNTLETILNLHSISKKKKSIFITENKNNYLRRIAQQMKSEIFEHKDYIGGRYSVLSEVGMLPAYLMGLNIKKFRKNLLTNFKLKNKDFLKESSTIFASLLLQKKFKNLIFLNYSPKLNKFLSWYQQLIAESLGKKNKGFLPVISTAPKDHHSLLQLYMDGPKDKLFYIFSEIKKKDKVVKTINLDPNIKFLNNKNLAEIKIAQKNALIQALKKANIPFREIKIKNFNEETLGQLFSYFILETALIGIVANVNPFDQPAVEQVKINTKYFLK